MGDAFSDTVVAKQDIAQLKAEIFRALWIQGLGLIGALAAITSPVVLRAITTCK